MKPRALARAAPGGRPGRGLRRVGDPRRYGAARARAAAPPRRACTAGSTAAVGHDPIAARAFADTGEIIIAVRASLIEDLTARVARQYLQQVTLDLTAFEAHAEGTLRRHTFIGRKKVGEWAVAIVIRKLVGQIRAGSPRLSFASNVLEVELPLELQPASGEIGLHFSWDSASLVNLVCKDFEVDLAVEGRVLRQRHMLRGQVELAADDEALTATPVVHERSFPLKLDLTPASWAKVEAALGSQNSLGRCGVILHPENVMRGLRELVARGHRGPLAALDPAAGAAAGAAGRRR